MDVQVRFDVTDLERGVADVIRNDMPFATVLGLTTLAREVRDDLKRDIATVFDRPRPFTINSPAASPARKGDRPVASQVYIKEFAGKGNPASKYLRAQVFGGARRDKGLEAALQRRGLIGEGEQMVPARGINLNRYGNVTGALVRRVLSQLRISRDASQDETARSQRRNRRTRNQGYFWSDGSGKLPKGVAERRSRGGVRMVFIAVDDASYHRRFDMAALVRRSAQRNATQAFRRATNQIFSRRRR